MKLFRVLMVLVFMLATVFTSAAVQAAGGQKVGFIRLLSSVDSKSPIQLQARLAYQRIKPQLLALQQKGEILSFTPEFKAGIVQVEYASNRVGATALPDYPMFDNLHDAIVDVPVARPSLLQTPSAEAITPMFYMSLYSSCFSADGLGADSQVIGSLRDKKGRIIASYEGYADGAGDLYPDCFLDTGSFTDMIPGYTLSFKVYDTTPALIGTFSATVPDIDFTLIDVAKAVVRGTAPAGKPYEVGWYHRNWNAADTGLVRYKTGTTSAAGAWGKDMGTKFRGGDWLDIYVQQNAAFTFEQLMAVPYIYCQLGSNYCEISGIAFKPVTLSIVHAGTTYSFSGTFDEDGFFTAELKNVGEPIFLGAGDRVTGTGLPTYVLPAVTVTTNFNTDVVHGVMPANRYFDLWAYTDCGCSSYMIYAHSNSAKAYTADFTSQVDLLKTAATNIRIYYVDPVTGNSLDYFRSYTP